MITAIVVVLIIVVVAVFSVQNATPVVMSFLFWKFEASLAILVFLCLLGGAVAGAVITSLVLAGRGKGGGAAGKNLPG